MDKGLESASSVARAVAARLLRYEDEAKRDPSRLVWWVPNLALHRNNALTPLIDGESYYSKLLKSLKDARSRIYVTGWTLGSSFPLARAEGKPVQANPQAVEFAHLLAEASRPERRADVRLLVWQNLMRFTNFDAAHMSEELKNSGVLVRHQSGADPGVRALHVHALHQKSVVIDGETAFCGGLDIGSMGGDHWDTREHLNELDGEKRPFRRYKAKGSNKAYWHDVQLRVNGPAVTAIESNFAERWADTWHASSTDPEPDVGPQAAGVGGGFTAQVIRTIPPKASWMTTPIGGSEESSRWRHRREEYSSLESYGHALINARRFVYMENQYFTCRFLIDLLSRRLRDVKDLSLVVLMPRDSEISVPEESLESQSRGASTFRAIAEETVVAADVVDRFKREFGKRVYFACPINKSGEDIYVHSKLMIVDDMFATVGSANFSDRSMFIDYELGVAWMDPANKRIASFRQDLWREHLGLDEAGLTDLDKKSDPISEKWAARQADPGWKEKRITPWGPQKK